MQQKPYPPKIFAQSSGPVPIIVLLPWQTKPFESKGRVVIDDPLARDRVTAGSPGGSFSNKA